MDFDAISCFFDENRAQSHQKLFLAIRNNKYTSENASRGRMKVWERTGAPEEPKTAFARVWFWPSINNSGTYCRESIHPLA